MTTEAAQPLDHNSALAQIIETGDTDTVQMLLGHKDRLRCGGVVRTGVKVPKSSCTPAEKQKFLELEAQGMGYDAIDEAIGGKPRTSQSKLFPKNADHFVVRACDFNRPADAEFIVKKYASPDGKVRSLPVWLSVGEIDKVLHHGFRAFNGGGQLVAASFYEGKDLKVRYLPKDFKGAPKKEDWTVAKLDPDHPVSPAGHKMEFGGIFRFNVPGLRGFDEIVVVTKSWHGMSFSVANLRRIRSVLGRFNGLLNGEPFLQLSKVAEDVKHDGKTVTQFIPVLELAIDPMELARYAEPQAVAARAGRAMQALAGAPAALPAKTEPLCAEAFPAAEEQLQGDIPFGADSPERTKATEALHAAAAFLGVSWPQFACWASVEELDGQTVEDADTPSLEKLVPKCRERCAKDRKDEFRAAVVASATKYGVE